MPLLPLELVPQLRLGRGEYVCVDCERIRITPAKPRVCIGCGGDQIETLQRPVEADGPFSEIFLSHSTDVGRV
jgi:hypothetical protein